MQGHDRDDDARLRREPGPADEPQRHEPKPQPDGVLEHEARREREDAMNRRVEAQHGQRPAEGPGHHEQTEGPLEVADGLVVEGDLASGAPREARDDRGQEPVRDHTEDDEEQDPQPLPCLQHEDLSVERLWELVLELPARLLQRRETLEILSDGDLISEHRGPDRDHPEGLIGEEPADALPSVRDLREVNAHEGQRDAQLRLGGWRPCPRPTLGAESGVPRHGKVGRINERRSVDDRIEVQSQPLQIAFVRVGREGAECELQGCVVTKLRVDIPLHSFEEVCDRDAGISGCWDDDDLSQISRRI